MDGIKNSVLTAFYTPPAVVDALNSELLKSGVKPDRFLDPSAGTGIFAQYAEMTNPAAEIAYFEKDPMTALILKSLNSEFAIRAQDYETRAMKLSNPNTTVIMTLQPAIYLSVMLRCSILLSQQVPTQPGGREHGHYTIISL